MKCSRCQRDQPEHQFSPRAVECYSRQRKGGKKTYRYKHARGRIYTCRDCEAQRLRDYRARKRLGKLAPKCCFGLFRKSRCTGVVRWMCPLGGAWRACSLHKLPGDVPLATMPE